MTHAAADVIRAVRSAPMWRDRTNVITTIALGGVLAYMAFWFMNWALVHAIGSCLQTPAHPSAAPRGETVRAGP